VRVKKSPQTVLVFVRVPEKGRVKTRLMGRLDPEIVRRLYMCFVEDILDTLVRGGIDVTICYDPSDGKEKMVAWLGGSYDMMPQQGGALGEKMAHAFSEIFSKGTERAVLIGSDFPDFEVDIVHDAFAKLLTHDVVLGPAADGGYYLIGFQAGSFSPTLFNDMPWGSRHVFMKTAGRITEANLSMATLRQWHDIDTLEDLKAFYLRAKAKGLTNLKTMKFLTQNRELMA